MPDVLARAHAVLDEVRRTLTAVDPNAVGALLTAVGAARAVYFDARGRSGLVARALAMRWMHLGLDVHVAGETVTPAIGPDDLLVCLSASGRTGGPLANARVARSQGARVGVLTGAPDSPLAAAADLVVAVPRVGSVQHAGSLFEQTCLVLGDAMCGTFQQAAAVPRVALDQRHANLL
jgi:6-phospho-3-hexuloisomerase